MSTPIYIPEGEEFNINGMIMKWDKSDCGVTNLIALRPYIPVFTASLDVEATIQAAIDREDYEYAKEVRNKYPLKAPNLYLPD